MITFYIILGTIVLTAFGLYLIIFYWVRNQINHRQSKQLQEFVKESDKAYRDSIQREADYFKR